MTPTQEHNVPALRFPGFEEEWSRKSLGDVATRPSYGMNAAATAFDGEHKYIRITDISDGGRAFVPNPLTSPEPPISQDYKLRTGDIVFARTGASTGKSYLYKKEDGDLYFAGFLIRFSVINADPEFVFAQTLRAEFNKWIAVASMRSGQPGINAQEYAGYKFNLPTLPEQRKIAGFLGAVDEKIAQLVEKKRLLEDYKKGCMQQLFSQKVRFKDDDGNDFPDWEEKRLGEVLSYEQPTKYLVSSSEYSDANKTPVLTAGKTFILGYTDETEGIFTRLPTIIFDDFTTAFKFVDFPFKAKSSAMKMLSVGDARDDIRFIHAAMLQIRFQVGEHKRYWIAEYQKEKIPFPSPAEQRKIADFLSALDRKIDLVGQELENAKTFKKGLLQQMFV